eukprot:5744247-Prymnesium_polylepis.1
MYIFPRLSEWRGYRYISDTLMQRYSDAMRYIVSDVSPPLCPPPARRPRPRPPRDPPLPV